MEVGKPHSFSVDVWLDYVEGLIASDETLMALDALEKCPAYYLDHYPARAMEIRESLQSALWTPVQYRGIYKPTDEKANPNDRWPLRFEMLADKVKELNEKHIVPEILELAPGGGGTKALLDARGHRYFYESLSLDGIEKSGLEASTINFRIFVAFEIIEHLHYESEIYQNYLKFEKEASIIMISTPLYTYIPMPEWRGKALGHLRTYTPNSFFSVVNKMFKGFNWQMHADNTMVLVGEK